MNAEEAVELCGMLDPTTIVPLHYEGWKHFRQQRRAAERVLSASPLAESARWLTPAAPEAIEV